MTAHHEIAPHTRLTEKVTRYVERRLDKGENVFPARPMMAAIAINIFMAGDERVEAEHAVNQATIDALRSHDAEGVVYTVLQDLGNGYEDSPHFVLVAARDGQPTNAQYEPTPYGNSKLHIIASTK